jgi:2-hydroxychromene-2-carboxylate isomerase
MGAAPKVVEFFFDPISPYAWLATHSLSRCCSPAC